jgi:predicted metal-binding membrane protein
MPHGHIHQHMDMASAMTGGQTEWATEAWWWLVMVAAMMFPMVLEPIRTTAERSLWRRRHRAISGFLTGYLGTWLMFGVVASVLVAALRTKAWWPQAGVAAASGFGAALLWQVTPIKRRAAIACHRTLPLAPAGWRADRDCLRYGWVVGRSCLVSCWALMLACLLAGHSVGAMVGVTAVSWAERYMVRPNQRLLCIGIAALAICSMVMTV